MTKRIAFLYCAALMMVAGCAPLDTYYRPGASIATLNRDTTACEVQSLRNVPPSTQVRRTPPEFIPPRRICDSAGNCKVRRGYYIPGDIITFDPNDGLRARVEQQCMADRGYAPVSIPPCPDSVASAAPPAATRVLPALRPNACVIRNRDGSFQIVNRG